MSVLLVGCTDSPTTQEKSETKTYTLENPTNFYFKLFKDSLFSEAIPTTGNGIIDSSLTFGGLVNPFTYEVRNVPERCWVRLYNQSEGTIDDCVLWAETMVCEESSFPTDTFFIPWQWVCPGEEF